MTIRGDAPEVGGVADATVIIVTYQSQRHICACLASVREARDLDRVIVVDNASCDGSVEAIRNEFPEVRVVSLRRNIGFAAACNLGVRASKGALCLFVNPDVRLSKDTLERLVAFAERDRRVGIVGPRVLDQDGCTLQLSCRSFPTIGSLFFHRFSIANRLFPNNPWGRRYLLADQDISEPRPVDWVSGCCMLVRRELLDTLGGFDERFFLFSEDVDLCLRAKLAGWETYYDPHTSVVHHIGGSSKSIRPVIERHRSVWRYYRKHMANGRRGLDGLIFVALVTRCGALVLGRILSGSWARPLKALSRSSVP